MRGIIILLFYLLVIIIGLCITPLLFMLLWNWLIPIFWVSAPILTFWQSFGIIMLIYIVTSLFKK
jgi:hypothetical protein